jgi:hypothetical protein
MLVDMWRPLVRWFGNQPMFFHVSFPFVIALALLCFWDRVLLFCSGWSQTCNPPPLASWVSDVFDRSCAMDQGVEMKMMQSRASAEPWWTSSMNKKLTF